MKPHIKSLEDSLAPSTTRSAHAIQDPAKLAAPPLQRERRAAVRSRSSRSVSFFSQPTTSEAVLWARVRNVSASGMGLILSRGIRRGSLLAIELCATPPQTEPIILSAHVVHCTPEACGTWLVGCRFDTPLTKEQLQACL